MPAPNMIGVVRQVNEHYPGLIVRDAHAFTNAVAYTLWLTDPSWGHNVKRGSQGLSEDAVCKLDDASPLKTRDGRGIYIIDIIGSAGSPNASPAWIDQTNVTLSKGETGAWSKPHPPSGGEEPAPTPVPTPTPQPTPIVCKAECNVTRQDITGVYEVLVELKGQMDQLGRRQEALALEFVGHLDDIKQRIDAARAEANAKSGCRLRW